MSYVAIVFLVFSVGFSWFSGDRKNDQLIDQLEESSYEQKTMVEQVRQSKVRATVDARKMSDLTQKVTKLSQEKERVERKLDRNKLRRARLLRPQIAKIKEKVEAPYKMKIDKMEKAVKTAKADLAKLKAENDKLKRQYRELIRKNKERVSEIDGINDSPISRGDGLEKSPVSLGDGLEKSPITQGDGFEKSPVSLGDGIDKSPVSQGKDFEKSPITKGDGLDKSPISREDLLDKTPVSKEGQPDTAPLSKEEQFPVVPEEELVELDNGQLVKLDNVNRREKIPDSKDLVSAEEILKAAEAEIVKAAEVSDALPDYIRIEQVNVKEGWL